MYLIILFLPLIQALLLNNNNIKRIKLFWFIWILLSIIFLIIGFIDIIINDTIIKINIMNWFLNINYSFLFDKTSFLLTSLIYIILNMVIIFSNYYINYNIQKFLIYLYLFAFTMLILVLNNNFIILFLGWELVGLISYLLISYWNNNLNNIKSGIKAILYNKISDIGIILIILYYITFNNYIIIGFLLGCIGKSAQIFLTGWLNSAMSGPTPVSSLLHSSTMVVAGVYILIRYNIIFYQLSFIGLLTLIFVSLIALYTNDIKSIIAYSTCSQLGYLTYSILIGINNYHHLIIHGFFKALLFISCGYIIHKFYNIQDLRKYGFFLYYLPIEYIFIKISTFSLIAFPFYSGFYTKELIILSSYFNYIHNYLFSLIGSFLTILYSFRLLYISFYNKPNKYIKTYYTNNTNNTNNNNNTNNTNNNNNYLSLPIYLIILIIGGLIIGDLLNKDYEDYENISITLKLMPFYFILFIFIFIKYIKHIKFINFINIFYIDELYNRFIILFYNNTYFSYKFIEKGIFDYIWLINII